MVSREASAKPDDDVGLRAAPGGHLKERIDDVGRSQFTLHDQAPVERRSGADGKVDQCPDDCRSIAIQRADERKLGGVGRVAERTDRSRWLPGSTAPSGR